MSKTFTKKTESKTKKPGKLAKKEKAEAKTKGIRNGFEWVNRENLTFKTEAHKRYANLIHKLRLEKGLSLKQAGAAVGGMDGGYLCRQEMGKNEPLLTTSMKVVKALGGDIMQLKPIFDAL
jgi:hypothetical protein